VTGGAPDVRTYVGAGSLLPPARGLALDPARHAWMPKLDGCYADVQLDGSGRIAAVTSRNGRAIPQAADLIGILAGAPDSQLAGELEAHTEAGNAAAARRGWRALHLFDCVRFAGRDVTGDPYAVRYGFLHRGQALVEQEGLARDATLERDRAGDVHDVTTGRYTDRAPRDLRRLPIVPLARGARAGLELWTNHVERDGGEGLVVVRLDAPAGRRGAKHKIKATDTLDCVVVKADARAAVVRTFGRRFVIGASGLRVGSVVEVAHDGWYAGGAVPRFPRVVRVRRDLDGAPTGSRSRKSCCAGVDPSAPRSLPAT
jgi:hypothetical protein